GKFLMSIYEVMSTGVSKNLSELEAMTEDGRNSFLLSVAQNLSNNEVFALNSGGGVRGTTRLSKLLPIAQDILKP
ncbi:MAG: DUF262 domain-containing protein, partial [Lentilitoribacter sp.]